MSHISVKGETSTSEENETLVNLAALAVSGANQFIVKTGPTTFANVTSVGGVSSVTGTTNQITVTSATGDIVLSLPNTLIVPGTLKVTDATASTSGATGALVVMGGIGTSQNSYFEGDLTVAPAGNNSIVNFSGSVNTYTRGTNGTVAIRNVYNLSRGSIASPTVLNTGQNIYRFLGLGYDGSVFLQGSEFSTQTEGTPSAGVMQMAFVWQTRNLAGSLGERMRLSNAGFLGLGTAAPSTLIESFGTTEQLRLSYDASNYNSFTTSSVGDLTIASTGTNGNINLTPSGTGAVVVTKTGLAATAVNGATLQNTTVSTSGATVQNAPLLGFIAHAWNTTATAADNFVEGRQEFRAVSGTSSQVRGRFAWATRTSVAQSGSFIDNMLIENNGAPLVTIGSNGTLTFVGSGAVTGVFALSGQNSVGLRISSGGGSGAFTTIGINDTHNLSSGTEKTLVIQPTYASSGTAGSTDFIINRTETSLGSGVHRFVDYQVATATKFSMLNTGKVDTYAAVATAGWGMPTIYASGSATAQTALVASVAAYTVGAADGTFEVTANVNVTTSTLHNFGVVITYTDETNTSRSLTLPMAQLAGTFVAAITNATGAGPYEGAKVCIRAKASTAITITTAGTFTTVTYNVYGSISQIA